MPAPTPKAGALGSRPEHRARALGQNRHVRFFDERNGGFVRCEVTPEEWRTAMKLAESIADPASPIRPFASFVVEDGKPGAESRPRHKPRGP